MSVLRASLCFNPMRDTLNEKSVVFFALNIFLVEILKQKAVSLMSTQIGFYRILKTNILMERHS